MEIVSLNVKAATGVGCLKKNESYERNWQTVSGYTS